MTSFKDVDPHVLRRLVEKYFWQMKTTSRIQRRLRVDHNIDIRWANARSTLWSRSAGLRGVAVMTISVTSPHHVVYAHIQLPVFAEEVWRIRTQAQRAHDRSSFAYGCSPHTVWEQWPETATGMQADASCSQKQVALRHSSVSLFWIHDSAFHPLTFWLVFKYWSFFKFTPFLLQWGRFEHSEAFLFWRAQAQEEETTAQKDIQRKGVLVLCCISLTRVYVCP